jgi:hypothetical protein
MTPDPYMGNSGGAGDPRDPQSWNKYGYVGGDPTNRTDQMRLRWDWILAGPVYVNPESSAK